MTKLTEVYDMQVAEIVQALKLAKADETGLDDAVHGAASRFASVANNGGFEEQVRFLLSQGWNKREILESAEE